MGVVPQWLQAILAGLTIGLLLRLLYVLVGAMINFAGRMVVTMVAVIGLPAFKLGRQNSICATCGGCQYMVVLTTPVTYRPCLACNVDQ